MKRTMTDECSNCRFWQAIPDDEHHSTDIKGDGKGHCRRYPPAANPQIIIDALNAPLYRGNRYYGSYPLDVIRCATIYPITYDCDTCGEFQKKENTNDR